MSAKTTIFSKIFGFFKNQASTTAQEAAGFAVGQASATTIEPFFRLLTYQINQLFPNIKAEGSDYIDAYFRGEISEEVMKDNLKELGFSDFVINLMVTVRKPLVDVSSIQSLYNRGEITEEEAKNRLAKIGFSEKEQEYYIKLAGYIPSVSDFIRFAVREVFTPEVAEKYGQFEDYPEELTHYAKMAGLDPEYAKYYWAAHWELPSLTMGFDMYHRGIISYDELKTLLRSLDVMPYWREKLIKLSETPFTRVDVRRMYQTGVLTFEEMVRAYMDIGYSPEKAEKLAEFTARDATEEERNLTKTEITTLYSNGTITAEEAKNLLAEFGYPEEYTNMIIGLADYKKAKEHLNAIKTTVKKRYVRGFINRNDVMIMLSREGIPSSEITSLINEWDIEKEEKTSLPTKTELKRFLQKGIINIEQYKDYMKRLNYPDEVVEMYIKDIEEEG